MICPECNGELFLRIAFPHNPNKCTMPCLQCDGLGEVPEEMTQWIEDGDILKEKRIAQKLTLRNAAKQIDDRDMVYMAIKLSSMERGVVEPDMSIYDNLKEKNEL